MKEQYILKVKYEQMLWAIGELQKAGVKSSRRFTQVNIHLHFKKFSDGNWKSYTVVTGSHTSTELQCTGEGWCSTELWPFIKLNISEDINDLDLFMADIRSPA